MGLIGCHCHCHCTCTCTTCNKACNSCTVYVNDNGFGERDPEAIRQDMNRVKDLIHITKDRTEKLYQNLKIVSRHKQDKSLSAGTVGPYSEPPENTIQSPYISIKSGSFIERLVYWIKEMFLVKLNRTEDIPLPGGGDYVSFQWFSFLNDKIHLLRSYMDYRDAVVCNFCWTTCSPVSSCTCTTPACTGGTPLPTYNHRYEPITETDGVN